jgi:hypothetical protein
MPNEPTLPLTVSRLRHRVSWVAGVLLLAGFWFLLQESVREKSLTYDEIVHATAGCTYWTWNDYRLNPENGNLPQRVAGLPLALAGTRMPPRDSNDWKTSQEWAVADAWFHRLGNNARSMVRDGRAACGLLAVALAALVWAMASRRFGRAGGVVALLFCVLNPSILANGTLMTSDTAAALFFLASAVAIDAALRNPSGRRIAIAGLAAGGLFVSKPSGFLLFPIAIVLASVRLISSKAPVAGIGPWRRELKSRPARAAVFAVAAVFGLAITIGVIWSFYGFRYSAYSDAGPNRHDPTWERVLGNPAGPGLPRVFEAARDHKLLPEAYVYGCAYAWRFSRWRDAFLNGEHSLTGWTGFFPYSFLVKTPLPLFGAMGLAAGMTIARWRSRRRLDGTGLASQAAEALGSTLPFWAVIVVDGTAAVLGHLDIGHRHLLPLYPPLFILCGAAAQWRHPAEVSPVPGTGPGKGGFSPRRINWCAAGLGLLLAAQCAETFWRFPDYLSYFNGLVRPSEGYRHFVDSSLDWGQDLPAAKRYIDTHPGEQPFHLAYFGSASPTAWGVRAEIAHCATPTEEPPGSLPVMTVDFAPESFQKGSSDFLRTHQEYELVGTADVNETGWKRAVLLKIGPGLLVRSGTYLMSATVLQQMEYNLDAPWGPWNRRFEDRYQQLAAEVRPLLGDDRQARAAALTRGTVDEWWRLLKDVGEFDALRFSRLTAYLRHRAPDGNLHGSILVFRLTEDELHAALDGPPAELGPDLPGELEKSGLLN